MLIVIAILLRLFAGASYIHAVVTNRAKPHVVSWFFWGLTALIAFAVQISQGVGAAAYVTLALGLGPMTVFILALVKGLHRITFSRTDKWCAVLTTLGIICWVVTKDPITALWMSIIADIISGVPTVIKCYRRPYTERAFPYALSVASMVVTLASISSWTAATALFPAYILLSNLMYTMLIATRVGPRMRKWQRQIRQQNPVRELSIAVDD